MSLLDRLALRKDNRMTDSIFQLAYIAGPFVIHQNLHGTGGKKLYVFVLFHTVFFKKMVAEKGNVFFTFAQRRQMEGNDIQPVI